MWKNVNFLCEIGTEEIPAGYVPVAINNIEKLFNDNLNELRITFDSIKIFATPRRFIITITNVADKQKEEKIEVKGPALERAYDSDGKMSKALQGFLRGNNLSEADLEKRETPKGTYIFGTKEAAVNKTAEIMPEIISKVVHSISFPKKMKWNTKKITFPRPIRYLLVMLNDKVVSFDVDGIEAGNLTRGHFIQSDEMFEVKKISEYPNIMKKANIVFDHEERKSIILKQLEESAKKSGGDLVYDEDLLNVVTFLVENPHVVLCEFNEKFLEVPDIVLIAEMKEHQKYFAILDKEGNLSNKFLVTSNNPYSDFIKKGNERVIAARFSDAEFFFKDDRKYKLEDKVDELKNVLFHKELGSIYDKIERMKLIAGHINNELNLDAQIVKKIDRALLLCKADLNTALVSEFTSLQGKIGKIYAGMDGEDEDVALSIDEHYLPRYHGDKVAENIISIVVSLSEKFDNLLGSFSVGNIPKGSQDPYALRRQSHAIIELLVHNKINLSIENILTKSSNQYKNANEIVDKIIPFIENRAKTYFQDAGLKYDEIDACLSIGNTDFYELLLRAKSLNEFRNDENFSQMLLSFKRMNNILSSFMKKNKDYKFSFNEEKLVVDTEKNLYSFYSTKKNQIEEYIKDNKYKELFSILIEGKSSIDKFFDDVMVMDKDISIRDNRLALISEIVTPFASLLDFSKISE